MSDSNTNNSNANSGGSQQGVSKKNNGKSKNSKIFMIIFVVLAVVALIGLMGYLIGSRNRPAAQSNNFYSYPTVSANIASSRDGRQHTVDIDLVIEYADGVSETISHDAVFEKMSSAVGSLDYEDLRQFDSVEHIESTVMKELASVTGEENILGVYVGNIVIDFPGFINSDQQNAGSDAMNQRLRGIFKNAQ